MGTSILDIAALAGVSKSTVSAVINNHPHVRPATRERVLEAIRQLDYHPNLAARELCTSSPMNIGILMPAYSGQANKGRDHYFEGIDEGGNLELVSQLIEQVSRTKYGLLVEHTVIADQKPELPSFAVSKRVAGIFQISPLVTTSYVQRLREYVPAVVEIGAMNPACDCVYTDFCEITGRSVDYLIGKGHRNIAFINCDPASRTAGERLAGYTDGLKKNGIAYRDEWVASSAFNGIGGYRAFEHIWTAGVERPTAVICAATAIAGGALRFMHENGIAVPDDVSIVCNGSGALSEFVTPQLTTVCRDKYEVAEAAFSLMMERLGDPLSPPRTVKTAAHMIERNSVKSI